MSYLTTYLVIFPIMMLIAYAIAKGIQHSVKQGKMIDRTPIKPIDKKKED